MTAEVKQFIAGAFVLIGVYLLLAHSGGLSTAINAGAQGSSTVFKTLQGR